MDKRNLKWITWIFAIATVLVVAIMLASTLQRDVHITLPASQQGTGESQGNAESDAPAALGPEGTGMEQSLRILYHLPVEYGQVP